MPKYLNSIIWDNFVIKSHNVLAIVNKWFTIDTVLWVKMLVHGFNQIKWSAPLELFIVYTARLATINNCRKVPFYPLRSSQLGLSG